MEQLTENLREILSACVERGMQLPFILCAISPNGSLYCIRCNDGHTTDTLAERFHPEGVRLPLNIMVVDQTGECFLIQFTAELSTSR